MSNADRISVPRELWDIFEQDWFPLVKRAQYRADAGLSLNARERLVPGIEMMQAFEAERHAAAQAPAAERRTPAGVRTS